MEIPPYTLPAERIEPPEPTTTKARRDNQVNEMASTPAFVDDAVPNEYSYSASDWWHNMLSVRRSSILRAIKVPVLAVSLWSTAVSILHSALMHQFGPAAASKMCMDSKIHSFLVSALGLLLVFRTNSAYQRFKDGRNIWERIHSLARNLSRMALLYEPEFGIDRRRRVFRLLAAFPYLLHQHIQPQCDSTLACTEYGVQAHLPPPRRRGGSLLHGSSVPASCWVDRRELPWSLFPDMVMHRCLQASNRPLWACDRLGHEVQNVPYGPNFTSRERLSLLSHVEKLTQCIGECERISFTAVPLNYARHSLRSLTLWLFTLPFAVVGDLRLATGPVVGLSAWLLYGIYQIGYQIEDPFQGSLRLSTLCHAIYRDVMDGTDCFRRRATAFAKDTRQDREAWKELEASGVPPAPPTDDDEVDAAAATEPGNEFIP
jgi:predicted membrane chloride channel (bestrophin family)